MAKLDSPAAERNKDPIWQVFNAKVVPRLSADTVILEIAAGTGQHVHYISKKLLEKGKNDFQWYPADMDDGYIASTEAYIVDEPELRKVVHRPVHVTLNEEGILEMDTRKLFENMHFDCIVNINMIHVSPWSAAMGLMKVAGEKLKNGGTLFLYGPYKVGGTCVQSNQDFDKSLRQRDPSWGVRNLEDVIDIAEKNGLSFVETFAMPANNLVVLFHKN
jgi:SAM-dependent methyltransferase